MKKLHRSQEYRILLGIMGGLGEYTGVDPNIYRLVYIVITVFSGVVPGVIIYLLAALLIPQAAPVVHTPPRTDDTGAA